MPTRNINLTPHLDEFIDTAVASGRYQNASEVVRDGLRVLEEQAQLRAAQITRFRSALAEGEEDLARGDYVVIQNEEELDAFMDGILQRHEAKYPRDTTKDNGHA